MPCSYQPTATSPFETSNQCEEQFTAAVAFESEPFSSVIHVSSGQARPASS